MKEPSYSRRLQKTQGARWKLLLDVQRPYRLHLRTLRPGFTLDIGCGIGRNLAHLRGNGVGVDSDAESVAFVRNILGFEAYTPAEFQVSRFATGESFDTLLCSHVLEHLSQAAALNLLVDYLPRIRGGGRVIVQTPQEAGYASDATHIRFVDHAAIRDMASELSLCVLKQYSFPFPRPVGKVFRYNEFVSILEKRG
jgi:2-polyprenyl-3-methyl-5-hydroxy-6-metoxy-1,4-benzoquinol methylase